ncbi:MAG: site-2 protease family protein [Tepidanaerobacteraceae bacterium]|jgi:Zn-dependent protease|nr:site-2 protease family protein [Tepidanaerobacter sp.]HQA59466.1 site-2 protease family protein [Tepidanaerobacteraceae bacterium]HQE05841.1 site-2 protease family protein [Tepidanaerobacteraceae bacterium]
MTHYIGPEMLLRIPALLIAISFHEYAHARVSYSLGDPTPKWRGRLSLNPLVHLDPIGLIMLWLFRFGWAKPVEINPSYYKEPKKGTILVSLAGPMANLILAFIAMIILKLDILRIGVLDSFIYILFLYNLTLAVFNLIPIPPLDGSKILAGLLPARQAYEFSKLEAYGPFVLILLVYFGLLGKILNPLIIFIHRGLDVLSNLALLRF